MSGAELRRQSTIIFPKMTRLISYGLDFFQTEFTVDLTVRFSSSDMR